MLYMNMYIYLYRSSNRDKRNYETHSTLIVASYTLPHYLCEYSIYFHIYFAVVFAVDDFVLNSSLDANDIIYILMYI